VADKVVSLAEFDKDLPGERKKKQHISHPTHLSNLSRATSEQNKE
jgi:hypothetical protein